MKRVTVRIPEPLLDDLDTHVEQGRFPNRSEAVRQAVRDFTADEQGEQPAAASLSRTVRGGRNG